MEDSMTRDSASKTYNPRLDRRRTRNPDIPPAPRGRVQLLKDQQSSAEVDDADVS
jgi:hypothetical protein